MKKNISVLINNKIKKFNKTIKVASDKSLSLRALILASQCIGKSKIKAHLVIVVCEVNRKLLFGNP